MATQPTKEFSREELLPFQALETAREVHGQFAPNLNLPPGQTVSLNSATNRYVAYESGAPTADVNEVQTVTLSAAPTGGHFTLGVTTTGAPQTTANIAHDATGAAITAALEALPNVGPGDITATRSGTVITLTFGGALAGRNMAPVIFTRVGLVNGGAPVTGTVATTTGGATAEGRRTAAGFLRYRVKTDAQGNITNFNENGALEDSAPIFYTGRFRTTDLVGFDASALTDLNARIISGTLADGVVLL